MRRFRNVYVVHPAELTEQAITFAHLRSLRRRRMLMRAIRLGAGLENPVQEVVSAVFSRRFMP